jgi:hypothetical protein
MSADLGAFADGSPCSVSAIARVEDAGRLAGARPAGVGEPGFGDVWQNCLVAEGALDVACDRVMKAAAHLRRRRPALRLWLRGDEGLLHADAVALLGV